MLYQKAVDKEKQLWAETQKEPKTLVFGNSKTGQSFRSLMSFCHWRTVTCTAHCYGCKGPISWDNSVNRVIAVRKWINEHGVDKAAERMATEISHNGIFRWMDRGDFDPPIVYLANRLLYISARV